jgi:tRNA(fMet)-specific endonuclease VapC
MQGSELKLFMLDTNMASYIIKGANATVQKRLENVPMANVCISSITQAELLRGVALKPSAKNLSLIVNEFLLRVEILPWDSPAAESWATLRTIFEKAGKTLATMDMLIAAHANSCGATLVTNDKAFYNVRMFLSLEDWTK